MDDIFVVISSPLFLWYLSDVFIIIIITITIIIASFYISFN